MNDECVMTNAEVKPRDPKRAAELLAIGMQAPGTPNCRSFMLALVGKLISLPREFAAMAAIRRSQGDDNGARILEAVAMRYHECVEEAQADTGRDAHRAALYAGQIMGMLSQISEQEAAALLGHPEFFYGEQLKALMRLRRELFPELGKAETRSGRTRIVSATDLEILRDLLAWHRDRARVLAKESDVSKAAGDAYEVEKQRIAALEKLIAEAGAV